MGQGTAVQELVFVGPERLAGHLARTAEGVRISDLQLSAATTGLVEVCLVILLVPRTVRTQAALASLQGLSDCLDFRRDPAGSDAVADSMTTRLESLLSIPGCEVLIAGSVEPKGREVAGGAHYLWLGADAPAQLARQLDISDGRVVRRRTTRPDDIASRAQDPASNTGTYDYALLRIGPAPVRPRPVRSLAELRRRHLLVGAEADESRRNQDASNSWSERARHSRAIVDTDRIMRAVAKGDHEAAGEALRQALQRPDAATELSDRLTHRIRTQLDFWAVHDALLARVTAAPGEPEGAAHAAEVVADSLLESFAKLVGLEQAPDPENMPEYMFPVVTPTVLEIGENLRPFVDSQQDNGHFLYDLIPAMKERIQADVGVAVPGVRARGSGVADSGCAVLVEETPRLRTYVDPGEDVVVGLWLGGPPPPRGVVTTLHPVRGDSGVWLVQPAVQPDDMDADSTPTEPVSTAQRVIHHLETVLRQSLACYLGPQEVAALVEGWDGEHEGLATATAPDTASRLRLTWLLQGLVREQVPITRAELLLRTVRDAPRSATPVELHRLVRVAVRAQLPGPRGGDLLITLPPELEAGLAIVDRPLRGADSVHLQRWLRSSAAELGPAFSVVTSGHEAREFVSAAATGLHPLVTTFSAPELEP
jgi:hypothetical protein